MMAIVLIILFLTAIVVIAVVDALLDYQEVNKLLTTYVDAYLGTDR